MLCIHHGSNTFEERLWNPVTDKKRYGFSKCYGGLWASPVGAAFGWREWSFKEGCWKKYGEPASFQFNFTGKLFILNSRRAFYRLPWENVAMIPGNEIFFPQWEALIAQGYEGIYLGPTALQAVSDASSNSLLFNFHTWDVETVWVWDKSKIQLLCHPQQNPPPKNCAAPRKPSQPSSPCEFALAVRAEFRSVLSHTALVT